MTGRRSAASLPFLFLLKHQFIPVGRGFNFVSRFKIPLEQAHRKRIERLFLNGAFERARAELRVVRPRCLAHTLQRLV